jgi:putative membrane protein
MENKINSQALLEFICFAAFSFLTIFLVISGKYLSYVTPKMAPYLVFTSIVMLVWAISSFFRIFRPVYRTHAAYCLVLILPIIIFLLPHSSLETAALSSGYSGANAISQTASSSGANGKVDTSNAQSTSQAQSSSGSGGSSDAQGDDSIAKQFGLALSADGTISVSDQEFYPWLSEISENTGKYEGKTITLKGFVFKDSTQMSENEFVPARLLMYCCSADLTPCGLLCRYDGASSLTANSWVTVTGTLHEEEVNGSTQAVITAESVSPAEKPGEEYVYPW